jgi:hypothetical protein
VNNTMRATKRRGNAFRRVGNVLIIIVTRCSGTVSTRARKIEQMRKCAEPGQGGHTKNS